MTTNGDVKMDELIAKIDGYITLTEELYDIGKEYDRCSNLFKEVIERHKRKREKEVK
jgi:hypothetical protein